MSGTPWGASPADWTFWSDTLGLTEDLLPVVSNPQATISEKSKMRDLGKTPSRYNAQHEAVGIPQWTAQLSSDKQVGLWLRDSDLGICCQTRRVRAIDVDIADPVHSARVRDLVELLLGPLPARTRGNSGKLLLAFTMPGDFVKRIIRTDHGIVEFLANGQQFIAVGTHPSGVRYEWAGLEGGLPEVTPAEFEALWQGIAEAHQARSEELRRGVAPSIPRAEAQRFGDPVTAFLHENGWVREFDRDGRVHVRCPWEAEHTSDSGPSSTSWFPAGVGGFQQGHFKCLHAHCSSRTDGDFMHAIGYEASQFEVVEVPEGEQPPLPQYRRQKDGAILANAKNLDLALRRADQCGCRLTYDDFKAQVMISWAGEAWRPLTDNDYVELRIRLEEREFKQIGRELIRDVVHHVAHAQRMDSAQEWAKRLQWDGKRRIESLFPRYFGTVDTPYTRAVGRYVMTALAGRALAPGVKADMVPVLVGAQGVGKTSGVRALAPVDDAFVELPLDVHDDNLARKMRGKLVGELGELRGIDTRDGDAIKQWLTRTHEEWTPKFQEFTTRFPRRLVLFGTVNRSEFLVDETGERRWLPMEVGKVDVAAIERDREQLWAEGAQLFELVGVDWEEAQALAHAEHHAYKASDAWTDEIDGWLARDGMDSLEGVPRGLLPVRTLDVLVSALRFDTRRITKRDEMRAGTVMRALGYDRRQARVGGANGKFWFAQESARSRLTARRDAARKQGEVETIA